MMKNDPTSDQVAGEAITVDGEDCTHFLNVDLEIYSKSDLQPLIDFMGKKVFALFVGRDERRYCAKLELGKRTRDADSTIRGLCALIRSLPRAHRETWNAAKIRDFSIGVQAGMRPNAYDIRVQSETVRAVSELNARIVITIYGVALVAPR